MEFTITSKPQGFVSKWFLSTYPSNGNKEQAGDMRNIDPTDPSTITQGRGMVALTAGTQAAAVTTLIKGMTRNAVTTGLAYGVGGAKLYQFSSSAVTNAGIWPHTIDKATVTGEDGEDVCHYKGALYYSYNHSGSAGDIGKYNLDATFDDDYGSTVPTTAAALQNAPHQMVVGRQRMYIANGSYIAVLDGTEATYVFIDDALDFYNSNLQVSSITWNGSRLVIATNSTNLSGSNSSQSVVYNWDGYSDTWDSPIEVNGRIGALYTKNGVTYIWYESFIKGTAYSTFGYLSGGSVIPLKMFTGSLPLYYQVGEMGDFIVWLSGQRVYAYGPLAEGTVELWQYTSATYATGGGMALPFGLLMIASNATTNYNLAVESGYTVDSFYYTKFFPVSTGKQIAQLNQITVWTEQLASGAKLDCTLRYDGGKSSFALDQIAYSASNPTRHIIGKRNLPQVEDFRLEMSFANGSITNPVRIKSFMVEGHFIDRK